METPNFARAIRVGSPRVGRVVPCVGAPAHVAVPKILSRHRPCALCTFVQPVCSTLPRAFVRVVHPWKAQISYGPCTHGNPKFRSGGSGHVVCGCPCKRVRASRSGRAVPCVGAREHVAMQKMLRRDHPCAFCMFARPICSTLPRAFVRVVHPWKPQISFGRVGSCRAWVQWNTGNDCAARSPESPLCLGFGRVSEPM